MIKTAKTINYWVCIIWLIMSMLSMISGEISEGAMLRCSFAGICYFLLKDLENK